MIILHCTLQQIWDKEAQTGTFGENTIMHENSITCINPKNITKQNFSHPTTMNHVILCINTDAIDKNTIKYEENNIYISKPIPSNAVVATLPYTYDENDTFVKTHEITDLEIMNEVLEKLNISLITFKYFRDGTDSRIFLLNGQYIVKQNTPELLKSEVEFYENYKNNSKLQKVILTSDENKYIVYEYILGDVMHTVDDFEDAMENIIEITNSYKNYNSEMHGHLYAPSANWADFLKTKVHEASLTFSDSFDFLPHTYEAVATLENYTFTNKLIHGDFGTHNFIKKDQKFVAAIDPIPTAGDPLYDICYACLSNPDIVKHLSVNYLAEKTKQPKEKIKAMLTVTLFCRLAICSKHHKQDLETYIDFWYKIIEE